MSDTRHPNHTDPIATRAAIDRGETGEKVAGFDPATVPLETDSEAGGVPMHSASHATPSRGTTLPSANASDHGNAMRPFDDAARPNKAGIPLLTYALAVLVAIVAIVAIATWLN